MGLADTDRNKILQGLLLGFPAYYNKEIRAHAVEIGLKSIENTLKEIEQASSDLNHALISGFNETTKLDLFDKRHRFIRQFLYEKLSVNNKEALINKINLFYEGSPYSYNLKNLFSAFNQRNTKKENLSHYVIDFISKNKDFSEKPNFCAFDISMCVLLCRLGLYANWLSKAEVEQRIISCAALAKRKYKDYHEYYMEGLVAHTFYNRESHVSDIIFLNLRNLEELYHRLL